MTKVYNFLEVERHLFYSSNYRQGENSRPAPQKSPLIIYMYTKHRELYKKRWFLITQKLSFFILFAVFGGRSILIKGDFWGWATISHLADSKEKERSFFPNFNFQKLIYL